MTFIVSVTIVTPSTLSKCDVLYAVIVLLILRLIGGYDDLMKYPTCYFRKKEWLNDNEILQDRTQIKKLFLSLFNFLITGFIFYLCLLITQIKRYFVMYNSFLMIVGLNLYFGYIVCVYTVYLIYGLLVHC